MPDWVPAALALAVVAAILVVLKRFWWKPRHKAPAAGAACDVRGCSRPTARTVAKGTAHPFELCEIHIMSALQSLDLEGKEGRVGVASATWDDNWILVRIDDIPHLLIDAKAFASLNAWKIRDQFLFVIEFTSKEGTMICRAEYDGREIWTRVLRALGDAAAAAALRAGADAAARGGDGRLA